MGLTGPNGEPLVCGGYNRNSELEDCYTYEDNQWIVASTLTERRESFAGSKAPQNGLFVTGGKEDDFRS